ncbi:hypothetical protein U91I_02507 [alpha proteobacterium U9-1i]|nr:hypothetical protein U91I_02507 [alpha proteobacterium U9-1i]
MWAKSLLLAAVMAISSMVLPGLGGASSAQSVQPGWMVPVQDRGQRAANVMSMREAADLVRSRYGGRLLNASREDNGNRVIYVLVWELPSGDRRDFRVDAATGQIS